MTRHVFTSAIATVLAITSTALADDEPLLGKLRAIDVLKEGQPGIFRWKSKAFLHFHYGHDNIEADVRITDAGWTKFDVSRRAGQQALLRAIRKRVGT